VPKQILHAIITTRDWQWRAKVQLNCMLKVSGGLLLYRIRNERLEVLLVHPGGPFWAKKDLGSWTIPKGEIVPGEDPLAAASREFEEELGFAPQGNLFLLGMVSQKGGKSVHAWAFEGNCNPAALKSNTFMIEWPPRSGRMQEFPEVDRAEFFGMEEAKKKINPAQVKLLLALERHTYSPPARRD
jgi:predicted NUDIX family NTP pyrophosphohydrolase